MLINILRNYFCFLLYLYVAFVSKWQLTWVEYSWLTVLVFSTLYISSQFLLAYKVFAEKSAYQDSLVCDEYFSAYRVLSLIFESLIIMFWRRSLLLESLWGFLHFMYVDGHISTTVALNKCSAPFSLSSPSETLIMWMFFFSMVPHHSFRLSLLFFILISLFSSDSAYPDMSWSSQILSSAWLSLLLTLPIGFVYSLYSQAPEYLVLYYYFCFFAKLLILFIYLFVVIELSILNLESH